jgi:hypothetical protein
VTEWAEPNKKGKDGVVKHSKEGVAGRSNREEAYLMQLIGVENENGKHSNLIETDRNLC